MLLDGREGCDDGAGRLPLRPQGFGASHRREVEGELTLTRGVRYVGDTSPPGSRRRVRALLPIEDVQVLDDDPLRRGSVVILVSFRIPSYSWEPICTVLPEEAAVGPDDLGHELGRDVRAVGHGFGGSVDCVPFGFSDLA